MVHRDAVGLRPLIYELLVMLLDSYAFKKYKAGEHVALISTDMDPFESRTACS